MNTFYVIWPTAIVLLLLSTVSYLAFGIKGTLFIMGFTIIVATAVVLPLFLMVQ